MNLGELEDDLLNMGKEKGKEMADDYLGEKQGEGGLMGTAVGFGKELLDKELGGGEQQNPNPDSTEGASPEDARGQSDNDGENESSADDSSGQQ